MGLRDSDLSDFNKLDKIGEGTYGVVYKGRNKRTNEMVAMKKIRLENEEEGVPATTVREISMLCELRHPNIVELQDVIMQHNRLYLIFEFLSMDLKAFMDRVSHADILDKALVKNFMFQICQAMCFCHQRRILHRDLKPQNILIDTNSNVLKIADFGLARAIGIPVRQYTHEIVTLWYRSPEILLGAHRYAMGVDVWSVGCIMAELGMQKALFQGDSEIDQVFRIFMILGTPTEEQWKDFKNLPQYKASFPKWTAQGLRNRLNKYFDDDGMDLIEALLVYDPMHRISMRETLNHRYFNDVDYTKCPAGNYRGELILEDEVTAHEEYVMGAKALATYYINDRPNDENLLDSGEGPTCSNNMRH